MSVREPVYDVVVALNYYAPYVSGVTEAARMTAEGWAARGYRVLVVAGHHDPATPAREVVNGVRVIRTPVVARIGKGTISPAFVPTVARWARRARLLHLHLPMLEAGAIAAATRGTPLLVTYQCDVTLPPGLFNAVQVRGLDLSHRIALRAADAVAVTSDDYARSSRLWPAMAGRTVEVPAPARDRSGGSPTFRDGPGPHVGFVGRIVEEKGLEFLVDGFRAVPDPAARLLLAGDFAKVAGGSVIEKVRARIGDDPRIRVLGFVADEELPDFYASLDVLALPSINSLEAFGIVQVEAMMQGVPVIASDLPGVRMPVRHTGFGREVPRRDAAAITRAVEELRADPPDRAEGQRRALARYALDVVLDEHVRLLESLALPR
ncbi:glycosyl transferase family 1 [Cellulomonas hominis]|uniref:D-inositol 3-phosphate glycosyltransferase n=1 Tax=Cellulomonas hominis TaxID=156981 RepID=A0A511F7F7_9CELL|nr:glycosyltransferase family 4 protein [Cellulomonas hominis]MBB5474003.1 glycosyltransferase involved in cell wall biosynthesis [Cellulomonas hominis]GEL45202.1 glycosyl transferase family 1 [Cellulomonas hominis]